MFHSFLKTTKQENGNITPLLILFLLGCFCLILFIGAFANVYIAKRQSQTAADASVLAAQMKLQEKFNEALVKRSKEVADDYLESLSEEPNKELTISTDIHISRLENALINHTKVELLDIIREPHFKEEFSQKEMSDLLYDVAKDNWQEIRDAASSIAVANGSEADIYLEFPYENKAKLYGVVKRKFNLPIFNALMDEEDKYIGSQATVLFKSNNFSFPEFDFSGFFYFTIDD